MNRREKQLVAELIISAIGDRLEFLTEYVENSYPEDSEMSEMVRNVDISEISRTAGHLLKGLPGNAWHDNLSI